MSANGDTVTDWLSLFPGRIGLVRLCDGNWHGWRAWGDGVLPVDRYLRQLTEGGYQGDYSLYLPGERYIDSPTYPDEKVVAAMKEVLA